MPEPLPTFNVELAEQVLEVLERHPSRHYQGNWVTANALEQGSDLRHQVSRAEVRELRPLALTDRPATVADYDRPICQTTGCVAGWAAILSAPEYAVITMLNGMLLLPRVPGKSLSMGYTMVSIEEYAISALGLTDGQANWLFDSARSRHAVIGGLRYLIGHPHAEGFELADEFGEGLGD